MFFFYRFNFNKAENAIQPEDDKKGWHKELRLMTDKLLTTTYNYWQLLTDNWQVTTEDYWRLIKTDYWWFMIDDWQLMLTDNYVLMTDDGQLLITTNNWWLTTDDWWLMTNDWQLTEEDLIVWKFCFLKKIHEKRATTTITGFRDDK